jgi:hypothetical protein
MDEVSVAVPDLSGGVAAALEKRRKVLGIWGDFGVRYIYLTSSRGMFGVDTSGRIYGSIGEFVCLQKAKRLATSEQLEGVAVFGFESTTRRLHTGYARPKSKESHSKFVQQEVSLC